MGDALRSTIYMTRRTALGTLAAAGAGFALWPYRPRKQADIPPGRTVLTYWEKWTGAEGAAIQSVVDDFNASHSTLWVERTPVSDIEPKAMVAIGGGDAPDLVGLFNYNIPLFAEAGAIHPLSALGAHPDLTEAHYAPAIWRLLTYEGEQWAGVSTCHTMALYYNRAILRDAGLAPPRTTAELDAAADALTLRDAAGAITRAGFLPNLPFWWPHLWSSLFGGVLYDPLTHRARLNSAENVAAFQWVADYPRRYGRDAANAFAAGFGRAFNSAQDPFLAGRTAMIVQGPWLANFARRVAPDVEYGCVPVPVAPSLAARPEPTGLLEADVVMIPRNAPRPEAAFEFLCHLQRRDVVERLARAHCKGSPLRQVSAAFAADHPNPYVAVHDRITRSPHVQTAPPTRAWTQYAALIMVAFDAIWDGADVTAELTAVNSRAQQLIDTARARRAQRQGSAAG